MAVVSVSDQRWEGNKGEQGEQKKNNCAEPETAKATEGLLLAPRQAGSGDSDNVPFFAMC